MTLKKEVKPIEIFLVEDNPGDIRLSREALRGGKVRNRLSVAENGAAAVAFLRKKGKYRAAPRPDLILLDLNLPGKSGFEVLREIKADPDLKRIPVVVLTASEAEEDIVKSYDLHANCYIAKPVTLESFLQIVRSIESFWLTLVKLPP
jgi:CheY-like chemotaxis protein